MDKEDILNQIESTVAQSPVKRKQVASRKIAAQDEDAIETTRVTGDVAVNEPEQIKTEPGRGVEFTKDTEDVYSGGIAIPKSQYNTRRQASDTEGNPLYFDPNYQEVVPFDVATGEGLVRSNTLDPDKLAWQIATSVAGTTDSKYLGYKEMPYAGTLGWWSHAAGGVRSAVHNLPLEVIKGTANSTLGPIAAGMRGIANLSSLAGKYQMLKPIIGTNEKTEFMTKLLGENEEVAKVIGDSNVIESIQDAINDSMNWVEREYGTKLQADLTDTSLSAQTARGITSGLVNFGAAILSHNPALVFTLLNFASQNDMRKNALEHGVSPLWSDVYSIGGSALNTALDLFQFSAITGGFALTRKAVFEQIAKDGMYKFHLGKALARNALDLFVVEPGTEMIQEAVEGAFDDDFLQHPVDRLVVAGTSAMALKAVMLPAAVRHAKQEERLAVAQALGVETQYLSIFNDAKKRFDSWLQNGFIDKKQHDYMLDLVISKAPDTIVKEIRAGTLGQLDKVPPQERNEFISLLKNIDKKSITKQAFDKLDARVDDELKNFNMSDNVKTMVKGVVRGLASIKLLQDGTAPTDIKIPKFVLAERGDSSYDAETNTITVSSGFNNTVFTKTKANANARDDENFNNYLRPSFVPSSKQSDRLSSLLHELAHWIDYQVGEPGFGDFLETYYDNIAYVFGDDKAMKVYKKTKKGANRFGRVGDKDTSTRNASEWNAQAVGRLGKRVAKQFGLSNSKAAKFLSFANVWLNQMGEWAKTSGMKRNAKILKSYQDAIKQTTEENLEVLQDLIDVFGTDQIRNALNDFLENKAYPNETFTGYLRRHNMLKSLFDVMDSFAGNMGIQKIADIFDSQEQINNFVEQGDIYFNSGYDNAVSEIQERRQKLKERKAKQDGATPQTVEASNDMRQVALSDGTVVSVPKNLKPLGSDTITEEDLGGKKKSQNEFVGVHAQLPIVQQLNQAQQMMEQKVDQQQIFKETGWFFDGKDKKWKYDIGFGKVKYKPVSAYYANGEPVTKGMFLDQAYDNEKLYEAYPILKDTYIMFTPDKETKDGRGVTSYDPKSKSFMIEIEYNPEDLENTLNGVLVHEIQHTIQGIENFARGGSGYEFVTQYDADRIRNIFKTQGKEAGEKATAELTDRVYDKYKSLAGEIEAENVKERYLNRNRLPGLGNPEGVLPNYTQRIPDSKAIVRFNNYDISVAEPLQETIKTTQEERLPNDYVADTDPTEEVRTAFENGKSADIDETPSYDIEVDGRKIGEDIASMTKGIMKRAKNLPNKIVKWAASSPFGWGLDRIMTTMFGRDVAEQFDVQGKYSMRNTLRSRAYTRFMKKLEPIIGNIETDKTGSMFKYKTMLNQLGFIRVAGVEVNNPVVPDLSTKKDLTGWEVMYVYLMKRMGPKFANRIQQTTGTNIDELISTLTEEEKQFANAMSDMLREIWIDRVGKERAMYNYFPIMDAEHEFFDETSIDNFRQRIETDNPIAIEDAGRLFSKEISRLASWDSGYYRTLKRLRDVLQYKGADGRNIDPNIDAELKKASGILAGQIKDIFGIDGYHNILRLLDTQIADPQEQMLDSASSKTLQQMGNNVIRSLLSFKFLSFPKNLVNITMMWGGAKDYSTYFNGFAEGVSDMAGTWKYMMKNSEEIRSRYDNIGYNEFLDQRNTGGSTAPVFKGMSKLFANMDWNSDRTGNMARMSAVLDMLGETGLKMFMLNGDAVANIYGGYGLIKDYMAQGLSETEAFKKLDRYIVEHQSSSNMTMKPLRQLEANKSLAGQLMAFTSEGVVKGASILGTFDEVKMGTATKSQAIANALSIAASMVLFALIGAGAWDLWDDDEKVREEAIKSIEGAMIDQVFGFSVLGNGFITPMVQNLLGVGGQSGISAPIWSVATEGITSLKHGEYDRVLTKVLESTGLLIGANAIYNDVLGIMLLNSPDPDIREAGFRMVLGHTQNYAEKRTGAQINDKENVEKEDEE